MLDQGIIHLTARYGHGALWLSWQPPWAFSLSQIFQAFNTVLGTRTIHDQFAGQLVDLI
jgi:hypothetical protein